jgi:RNA polymerase primary sigma factor
MGQLKTSSEPSLSVNRTGSARFNRDHVGAYLQILHNDPRHELLTRGEELEIAGEIDAHRWHLYGALFSIPPVAQKYVHILQQVFDKQRPLQRTIDSIQPTHQESKEIFSEKFVESQDDRVATPAKLPWVAESMNTVTLLIDEYRELNAKLQRLLSTKNAEAKAAVVLKDMQRCRNHMAILLREIRPKPNIRTELINFAETLSQHKEPKSFMPPDDLQTALCTMRAEAGLYSDARRNMTNHNLRLVIPYAKKPRKGLEFMEIAQMGNSGLMRATEKYERRQGYKFSTYASWWVKQAITRGHADESRTIRIPVHMIQAMADAHKLSTELFLEFNREPTREELAAEMETEVAEVARLKSVTTIMSLDMPVGESEDSSFGDFLEGPDQNVAVANTEKQALKDKLEHVLKSLPERERLIIKLRYGLEDGYVYTLEEVGRILKVTRERVRQIEAKAVRKLQHPVRAKQLQAFWNSGTPEERNGESHHNEEPVLVDYPPSETLHQ